jgi:hypothetical protein
MHTELTLAAVVVLIIIIGAAVWAWRRSRGPGRAAFGGLSPEGGVPTRDKLREAMRRLWFDHVDRTNLFIVSTLAGLPDAAVVGSHLHTNQDDIAAAFGQFYGARAASALARLLHEHIDAAGEIVKAHRDHTPTDALVETWYRNADEISSFLSKAGGHWPYPAMNEMMLTHLTVTLEYVAARVSKNWARAAALHDTVVDQAMHMADALVDGIQADVAAGTRS